MARPFLIIDGYNVLYEAGLLDAPSRSHSLLRKRRGLLKLLAAHLEPDERRRTQIVFDARNPPAGLPRRFVVQEMEVLFARSDGEADELIERLIADHSAPRQICLVSSDRRLQKAAKRRRANFRDSDVFLEELKKRGSASATTNSPQQADQIRAKLTGQSSAADIRHWLEIFGEIPEAAELNRAQTGLEKEIDAVIAEFEAKSQSRLPPDRNA